MARPGLSYEIVKETAVDLLRQGQHPSIQRVRQILGTGSNSTISEHLKRWQQELASAPKAALPASVPKELMEAVKQFWQVAIQQAEDHYQVQRDESIQQVKEAQKVRDEALLSIQQDQKKIASLERAMNKLESTVAALEQRLLAKQERCSSAEEGLKIAEQRMRDFHGVTEQSREDHKLQVHKLEMNLVQYREDVERRISEAEQRLRQERERGEANETRLMSILDQNRTEHLQERQTFSKERDIWKKRETVLLSQLEVLQEELGNTRSKTASAEEQVRQLECQLNETRTTLKELESRYLESVRLEENLRGDLKATIKEHQVLLKNRASQPKAGKTE